MSKLGARLIASALQAQEYAAGNTKLCATHTPIDVKALRQRLDLAQPEFANCFGLSVGTVRDWEQGRSVPDRPAQTLLRLIDAAPDFVRRVLGTE